VQNYVSSLNVSKQYFTSLLPFFLFPDKCMPFRLCLLTLSHSLQKKKDFRVIVLCQAIYPELFGA